MCDLPSALQTRAHPVLEYLVLHWYLTYPGSNCEKNECRPGAMHTMVVMIPRSRRALGRDVDSQLECRARMSTQAVCES